MRPSNLFTTLAMASLAIAQSTFDVPVPWYVTDLLMYNIRHGTGGTWVFNILDTSPNATQAFNTTCNYYGSSSYYFAQDDYPVDQPCDNPNLTFSLYPTPGAFQLNVTHLWGNCGTASDPAPCNDNGTWIFSKDDVQGQEVDVQNNFGQYGSYSNAGFNMYPLRAVPASQCEFC